MQADATAFYPNDVLRIGLDVCIGGAVDVVLHRETTIC